jgi:uncharacterized membrane protein
MKSLIAILFLASPVFAQTVEPAATPFGVVVYADVESQVFSPRCIKCHGDEDPAGDLSLTTYESIIANLEAIEEEALVNLTMPPKNKPLTIEQQGVLRAWIEQGAQQ